ncbi:hypothetical protein A2970_02555 [Candidatus Roizmanbacteria bacterium RIFCSPLOWO2_01_FULL_44_13]|uniref:SCP domain-containing protein n=1 Tax=Candidatus Roizmanbacteria bacterium RIFCSPLOWO2_01_FULL_44_13 TaxID=1802069 RepID=A0A1F7JCS1_9BACT|nr:MAG: hypothetical protein A2970_02555 [Candidatus Roizmanbacteria bacterium RIFCSPLOWO2_01_FULL_44_13]
MQRLKKFFFHFFIPHEENNFKARSLHPDFLGFYLILALVLTFSFKQMGLNNVLGFATDITTSKLYELTNGERHKNNLSTLTYNDKLAKAAEEKANDMFIYNYWAHYSPSGKTPWDFMITSGYAYEFAGENLAKNFLFSQGVVDAWMKSQSHRENILKKEYKEVGFAVVNGVINGEETTLVVQMFGTPSTSLATLSPPVIAAQEPAPTIGEEQAVLAKQSANKKISLPTLSFNVNIVFLSFLLAALALDFYFANKFNIIRVGGKNLAHFVFIFFMFLGLLIFSRGAIL